MKTLWIVTLCGWTLAGYFAYQSMNNGWEAQRMKMVQQISDERAKLLSDQIGDLEFQVLNTNDASYNKGFIDAMTRSESVEYTNGYHAAMRQLSETSLIEDVKPDSVRVTFQE